MENIYETIEKNGLTAEIFYDADYAFNPREDCDNFGTLETFSSRNLWIHETKGEDFKTGDDFKEWAKDLKGIVILPVYAYIHSGVTIKTGSSNPFTCPWDSGQVGVIYATKEKILKEFGGKLLTQKKIDKAIKLMEGEVKYFDSYLTGEVFGFAIKDSEGEVLDSCGGFIGDVKYCKDEALSMLDYYIKDVATKAKIEADKLQVAMDFEQRILIASC